MTAINMCPHTEGVGEESLVTLQIVLTSSSEETRGSPFLHALLGYQENGGVLPYTGEQGGQDDACIASREVE